MGAFAFAPAGQGGLVLAIGSASGPGEFWMDVSMLHSKRPAEASPEAAADFDFDWLFSPAPPDPALAVRPAALARMQEVQARIISVSPPIRIMDAPD